MNREGIPAEDDLLVLEAPFHHPPAYVLTLRGTAGGEHYEELEEAFTRAATCGHPLIVDLAALHFGDAALLGLLLNARNTCPLVLVGPLHPSFHRRLLLTGTDRVFTVRPSLTQALAALPN